MSVCNLIRSKCAHAVLLASTLTELRLTWLVWLFDSVKAIWSSICWFSFSIVACWLSSCLESAASKSVPLVSFSAIFSVSPFQFTSDQQTKLTVELDEKNDCLVFWCHWAINWVSLWLTSMPGRNLVARGKVRGEHNLLYFIRFRKNIDILPKIKAQPK